MSWLDQVKARLGMVSDYQFAQHVGIGATVINGWRNGRTRPSLAKLTTLAAAIGEDPRTLWALAGLEGMEAQGSPLIEDPLPKPVVELIALYRRLDAKGQDRLLQQVDFLVEAIGRGHTTKVR
jgi:transcriptional regulator with XRE-family HTH domain